MRLIVVGHQEFYLHTVWGIGMINESSERSSKNGTIKFNMTHAEIRADNNILQGKES